MRLSVDEVRDPNDNNIILQHHIPSRVQALRNAFMMRLDKVIKTLSAKHFEVFFEFRRGRLSLQEHAVEWDMCFDEPETMVQAFCFALQVLEISPGFMPGRWRRLSQRGQEGGENIFYEDAEHHGTADEYWSEEWGNCQIRFSLTKSAWGISMRNQHGFCRISMGAYPGWSGWSGCSVCLSEALILHDRDDRDGRDGRDSRDGRDDRDGLCHTHSCPAMLRLLYLNLQL